MRDGGHEIVAGVEHTSEGSSGSARLRQVADELREKIVKASNYTSPNGSHGPDSNQQAMLDNLSGAEQSIRALADELEVQELEATV